MDDETARTIQLEYQSLDEPSARPCLIALSGHTIGRVYPIDRDDMVLGRADGADLRIDVPGVSRRHARITRRVDEFWLADLGSLNGTWVEGRRVESHRLSNGERIQLGAATVLKFSLQSAIEEAFQSQLYHSATHDALTSAYNRRFFDDHLQRELSHARRHGTPLSLLAIDLDHFKEVNDTHGHTCGDKTLQTFGMLVFDSIRREDLFCRTGGEEFAVLMRETERAAARAAADRLRAAVEQQVFTAGSIQLRITISIGIATFDTARHASAGAFLEAADQALYAAKRGGRNRVCVA